MSAANRIPGKGRLTPALTARFTIDGRTLTAYEGDTVASAMIANGMHLAGRSFKYHRPRGILTAVRKSRMRCSTFRVTPPAASRMCGRPCRKSSTA